MIIDSFLEIEMLNVRINALLSALGIAACSLALSTQAYATVVYSNDFDGPAFVLGGVSAAGPTGGYIGTVNGGPYAGSNGKSWAGNYFGSGGGSTLTLSNLPTHTSVSIDMLLGFLNSWDSRDGGCCSPDNLDLSIDGSPIMSMTTNNALGTVVDFDGGTLLVDNGQIDNYSFYSDDLVDMATAPLLTFAHTASTLTLAFLTQGAGWQGWPDEGWGMDSLSVTLHGTGGNVPEPATLALMGLGLAGLGITRGRKA